jgi:hypothetical protein
MASIQGRRLGIGIVVTGSIQDEKEEEVSYLVNALRPVCGPLQVIYGLSSTIQTRG